MKPNRGLWSVVCLTLLAVLAPTACILYFMNEALNNQRAVTQQKLAEAYRGQLRTLQQRLDLFWETRAAALERDAAAPPAARFAHAVETHLADTVIYLGDDGKPVYPTMSAAPAHDSTSTRADWQAAHELETEGRLDEAASAYQQIAARERDADLAGRALQGQIRCTAPRNRAAALALLDVFPIARLATARDLEGRLIAADELLLTVRLLSGADPRRTAAAGRLHGLAADYSGAAMPSGQRLFVMEELRALKAGGGTAEFPTYEAEQLAARYFEGGRVRAVDPALRVSDIPEIWRLASQSGRVIGLYRESTVMASISTVLQQSLDIMQGDLTLGVNSPGTAGLHDMTVAVGAHMPGWQVVLDVKDTAASNGIAARQRASYIWVGILVIATLTVTALIASRAFLRQLRLARLKTDLVATVSHELKTPLAGMQLLVDTLLDAEHDDPVRTREYLELISRENARLSRLIVNFLTFSRMERNRAQFEFGRVDARAVAQCAVEAVGDRFHVELSAPAELPPIYADEDALVTVLLNLLDNAFKYTAEPREIRLRAYSEPGRCCFAVEDNGVGIAAREQRKVFRRFYQVDRRLTTHTGGVGLGLSIVEFIVKAHHGTVAVESRPGAGSRFTVSLPALTETKGAAA